jgi:hypothetical protein
MGISTRELCSPNRYADTPNCTGLVESHVSPGFLFPRGELRGLYYHLYCVDLNRAYPLFIGFLCSISHLLQSRETCTFTLFFSSRPF